MQKIKKNRQSIAEKIIQGIKIGRRKMLEEKSIKGEYVIYYEDGKIKREKAKDILMREKAMNNE
jgi:hypothetical protein